MSKGLNQFHGVERLQVMERRLKADEGGLGTWAAKDAARRIDILNRWKKAKEAKRGGPKS